MSFFEQSSVTFEAEHANRLFVNKCQGLKLRFVLFITNHKIPHEAFSLIRPISGFKVGKLSRLQSLYPRSLRFPSAQENERREVKKPALTQIIDRLNASCYLALFSLRTLKSSKDAFVINIHTAMQILV